MTLTRADHNHDCPCATDAVEHGPTCADCDCGAVERYKKRKRKKKTKLVHETEPGHGCYTACKACKAKKRTKAKTQERKAAE